MTDHMQHRDLPEGRDSALPIFPADDPTATWTFHLCFCMNPGHTACLSCA